MNKFIIAATAIGLFIATNANAQTFSPEDADYASYIRDMQQRQYQNQLARQQEAQEHDRRMNEYDEMFRRSDMENKLKEQQEEIEQLQHQHQGPY